MSINNFKKEMIELQKRDTKNAISKGYKTKKEWFLFIIKQEKDEIAFCIIDLAKKFNIPLNTVAYNFDPTMIMRVGKLIKQKTSN